MNKASYFKLLKLLVLFAIFCLPTNSKAQISIENLENVDVKGDFVVGPGKTELIVEPGETRIVNVLVTNRLGIDREFSLDVEDFTGSDNLEMPIILLGDEKGPYSLRDYITISQTKFILKHGQRATVPVKVSAPHDAETGGRYGSVVVSTATTKDKDSKKGAGSTALVTRIGALFFVTIPGEVKTEGKLTDFSTLNNQKIFSSGPVNFQLLYENSGNIHVNPYGIIRIRNIFGKEVGSVKIDPWFAMPKSLRLREAKWDASFIFGVYTAEASINRGYENIIDTKSITFYAFPWKILVLLILSIGLLTFAVRWVFSSFEIKRKN